MAGWGKRMSVEDTEIANCEELCNILSTEDVLKDFRSMECTASGHHFGFQHRKNPNIMACSAKCLAVTRALIRNSPNDVSSMGMLAGVKSSGAPEKRSLIQQSPETGSQKRPELENSTMAPSKVRKLLKPGPLSEAPEPKQSVVEQEPKLLFSKTMKLTDSLYNGAMVHVNFMWNYRKLTISAREDDVKQDAMSRLIDEHTAVAPSMNRQPEKDEILLAPYQGSYYRGKVVMVNGKTVTVEFIDYGDKATVHLSDCKELHSNIFNHPRYGAVLILEGVGHMAVDAKLAAPDGGRIEIIGSDKKCGMLYGRLWLDSQNTFNNLVNATFASQDDKVTLG